MHCKKLDKATILTSLSCIGVITTAVMAAKTTPKYVERIQKAEDEKGTKLSKWEKLTTGGLVYIPTGVVCTATIVCILGANVLNKRQQASLSSAYVFIDQSYRKYRHKLIELYGDDAHNKIVDSIAIDEAKDVYIYSDTLCQTYNQNLDRDYSNPVLFYDPYGHRYFEAPVEQVILAEYHVNRNFTLRGYSLLNEFYQFLGLSETDYGDEVGWCISDGDVYWIDFNHRKTVLKTGVDCYIIDMYEPTTDWQEENFV